MAVPCSLSMSGAAMSGVVYDPIYYASLTVQNGVFIVVSVYVLFLLSGLFPAIKAARLHPVEAARGK